MSGVTDGGGDMEGCKEGHREGGGDRVEVTMRVEWQANRECEGDRECGGGRVEVTGDKECGGGRMEVTRSVGVTGWR